VTGEQPDVAVELARLRKLEQSLTAERERIRAAAAGEVRQLQTALRETAARAAQRDRELQALRRQVQRGSVGLRFPRLRRRSDPDASGAVERVRATFERERQQLEERARAVAQTELRQRQTEAKLIAEVARLAKAGDGAEGEQQLLAELRVAEQRIAALEDQLRDHHETRAALDAARGELAALSEPAEPGPREAELARREEEIARREVELSLLRRRIGEEERRLQERAWRTGAVQRRQSGPAVARPQGEPTFSEGWRLLSNGRDSKAGREQPDWGDGNW
jgi:hypothetical protein